MPAITASTRMEFQAWDQAVKRLVRESAGCINLFTQRLCQVDVKTNDLVVCINRFKRRIGGFGSKTNGFGSCGGKTTKPAINAAIRSFSLLLSRILVREIVFKCFGLRLGKAARVALFLTI